MRFSIARKEILVQILLAEAAEFVQTGTGELGAVARQLARHVGVVAVVADQGRQPPQRRVEDREYSGGRCGRLAWRVMVLAVNL